MEFFQEPTFTALLALILTFLVAKIVTFAVSNSNSVGSVNEGGVGNDVGLGRELRVKRSKGKKRVQFVDDVMIRRIDRFEASENRVSSDDVRSVVVENRSAGGDFGERKGEDQCFDEREGIDCDAEREGSEKIEMPIGDMNGAVVRSVIVEDRSTGGSSGERKGEDQCFDESERDEKVEMLIEGKDGAVGELGKSLIVEEEKIGVEFDGDNVITDEKRGTGGTGIGESEDEDDGDWEGIERSELEKVFAEAVNYVEYGGKGKEDDHLAKLSSDVQMELYGLHKLAVEGPCAEPSPMAIKVSARARWNAWQRLGSMNQEAAMEQYIGLLTDSIPEWMLDYSAEDAIQKKVETVSVAEHERKSELNAIPVGDSSTDQSCVEKDDVV